MGGGKHKWRLDQSCPGCILGLILVSCSLKFTKHGTFFFVCQPPLEIKKDGERRTAAAAAAVQKRRESGGGHLQNKRRGAAEVGQRGAGAPTAEGRGRQKGRHRGARQSDAGGEPEAPAAPERDT